MIKFILHVAEMLALLVSAYLSQMVAILAVGLVFPPAIPLVSIAYLISIAAFWDEMVEVMSKGAIEIAKCETGQTTFPSALWSALISGFVSGLWYPSPKLADTLIPPHVYWLKVLG